MPRAVSAAFAVSAACNAQSAHRDDGGLLSQPVADHDPYVLHTHAHDYSHMHDYEEGGEVAAASSGVGTGSSG